MKYLSILFILFFALSVCGQFDQDRTPPRIETVGISPSTYYVGTTTEPITLTLRITDNQSGFRNAYVNFATSLIGGGFYFNVTAADRVSGTALDGIYQATPDSFVPTNTPGIYYFNRAEFSDEAGNRDIYRRFPFDPSITIVACPFSVSSASGSIGRDGGNITLNVTGTTGCNYTATSNADFITVSGGGNGNGSGTVTLSIQNNQGGARSGTVSIGGQTFTVNQALGCAYQVTPREAAFNSFGGYGSAVVTVQPGCNYTPVVSSFIALTSGANYSGSNALTFLVQGNTGEARTGTITIGNQTFTITQSAAGPKKRIRLVIN